MVHLCVCIYNRSPGAVSSGPPSWLATKPPGADSDSISCGITSIIQPQGGDTSPLPDTRGLEMELSQTRGLLMEARAEGERQRLRYQQEIDRLTLENTRLTKEKQEAVLSVATAMGQLKVGSSVFT